MNKERILKLADAIEHHKLPLGFNMDYWNVTEPDPQYRPVDHSGHNCGTVACIGGWAEMLYGDQKWNGASGTGKLLGLSPDEANDLFYGYAIAGHNIKPADAARVLRHLAKTGEVDWTIL